MTEPESPASHWRQGDYTLDLEVFPVLGIDEDGNFDFDPGQAVGAVVITQTCDIVNSGRGKETVVICPLVDATRPDLYTAAARGRTPGYAVLEHPPSDHVYVDLNRMVTIEKSVLEKWTRYEDFSSDNARSWFAYALERKHGRFAFPNDFANAMQPWQERVKKVHDKNTDVGRVYKEAILELRLVAAPSWDSYQVELTLYVILNDNTEVDLLKVSEEISAQIGALKLPDRFTWSDPPFEPGTLDDLTARAVHDGKLLDFTFLSIREQKRDSA